MKQERILVVDDEAIVRETIKEDLMEAGYDVVDARNGLEGVRQFKNGAIDLVISDLVMGEMDGLEVLKEVKKISPDTPVIIITGLPLPKNCQGSSRFRGERYHQQTRRHKDIVQGCSSAYPDLQQGIRPDVL